MDLQLSDKTALISGSHRGTGAVIARALSAEGASVILHSDLEGACDALAEELETTHCLARSRTHFVDRQAGERVCERIDVVPMLAFRGIYLERLNQWSVRCLHFALIDGRLR